MEFFTQGYLKMIVFLSYRESLEISWFIEAQT